MADLVTVDNGGLTDYVVCTDEITIASGPGPGHVAYNKLVDGTPNGTTPVTADALGLWMVAHRDAFIIKVTSSGLTTATTAYTSGDQAGAQMTFDNAARLSGGTGTVVGAILVSAADITGPFDLILAEASITLAADNAAYAISDADALKIYPVIQMATALDIGNNRVAQAYNLAIDYACVGGTSLFGGLITRTGHTFFGAATDVQVMLAVERN
jgi:hypothetical protein